MDKQFIVSYKIGEAIYINLTNRCSNMCEFCIRKTDAGVGYNLWLTKEPTTNEVLDSVSDPQNYQEIVFCGYGEPLSRLEIVKEVARELKNKGARVIRVNTNGLANFIHGRNVVPELVGLIDIMSISLNAQNAETYDKICHPKEGMKSYQAILEFAKECVGVIPRVVLSVVEWPEVDIEACRAIAEDIGAEFRVRKPTL